MLRSRNGEVGRLIERIGKEFVREAKNRAPVKSGALKSSIKIVSIGPNLMLEAGPTVEYSLAVSLGQPARQIVPVRRKALRFPDKAGTIVFAAKTDWPGTKPNPYLWESLQAAVARLA
jgi:hypothetical protein